MARVWQDRIVQNPRTFTVQNNADGTITLIPSPGAVAQAGTPVNATMLNGIETDITLTNKAINIDRFSISNLITNGDFSRGTSGWTSSGVSGFSVSNSEAVFTATSQYGNIKQYFDVVASNKYYICASVKTTGSSVRLSLCKTSGYETMFTLNHTGSGNYEILSQLGTMDSSGINNPFLTIMDYKTSGWTAVNVKYVTVINLTNIFGAGNEPTKAQMDAWLATYPNGFLISNLTTSLNRAKRALNIFRYRNIGGTF